MGMAMQAGFPLGFHPLLGDFAMPLRGVGRRCGPAAKKRPRTAAPLPEPEAAPVVNTAIARAAAGLEFGPAAFGPLARSAAPKRPAKVDRKLQATIPRMLKASVPGVEGMWGERGQRPVTEMLSNCYGQGLFMHGPPSSPLNQQIIPAIQFIFAHVAKLPPEDGKRVSCLTALAEASQECQQVQAREIMRIYGDLTAQNETFESQLKYILLRQKEAALNRYITRHHASCDLDHTQVEPWEQRAHLISGYVSEIGDEFGLDGVVAARSDRFLAPALEEIGPVDREELKAALRRDMSVVEWLQTLLADVNNQSASADRLINRECIFKWVKENMSGDAAHLIFYDEERAGEFEDHDPKEPLPENKFQPFLSCKVLVEMLLAAKMLQEGSKAPV